MNTAGFVAALSAAGLAAEWEEVRDSLWLAALLAPDEASIEPGTSFQVPESPSSPTLPEPYPAADTQTSHVPAAPIPPVDTSQDPTEDGGDALGMYLPTGGNRTTQARTVRVAERLTPLVGAGNIVRQLRPLKRRVTLRGHPIVNEEATVNRFAETGLWLPVFAADLGRWLDLVVVVDDHASMAIWDRTTRSLVQLFGRLGTFRRITAWRLDASGRRAALHVPIRGSVARDPRELTDPTGRTLVLLVSDGIGPGWQSGAVDSALAEWAAAGPVAIWQSLAPRLWRRTSMHVQKGSLTATRLGQPATEYGIRLESGISIPRRTIGVPVIGGNNESLAEWARLLVSGGSAASAMRLLDPRAERGVGGSPPVTKSSRPADPQVVLSQFRANSSGIAMHLAIYFAAIPLTLETMRIAQDLMMPDSGPSHLAEVFLGGLIRQQSADDITSAGGYDFVPGVREALLSAITRTEALRALSLVADGSSLRPAGSGGFRAILDDPLGSGVEALNALDRPFARVARTVLSRLGGDYAELVREGAPIASSAGLAERITVREPIEQRSTLRDEVQLQRASRMKIYRPMIFVGLGGTGCKVGAELERRLRAALCGPDGMRLLREEGSAGYLPYQLPRCLQFVYADLSVDELDRVRREVVPGREHDAAAQRTMRLMTNLIPADLSNSAAVSQRLSLQLGEDVVGWLPPKETDPNVGPLIRGAGQLPTVGRAVLFETMRRSPITAVQALGEALTDINRSGEDLAMVSDGSSASTDQIDVFVVFSVAGGTGSGIFYDYLHLIGDVLKHKQVQLYPLVLMPSSFDGGGGGGRAAELNAGSSLIDLFRLVDDQNAQGAQTRFDSTGWHGALSVRYPEPKGQVHLSASTVQSGFLFGRPIGGLDRDSIGRSMAALMLSIIGAGPNNAGSGSTAQAQAGATTMSFADSFINGASERNAPAETGIGLRGVSTSAVAELTVPLQEITDVLSSHFLANAITELREPLLGMERNGDIMLKFLQAAGLDELIQARPLSLPPEGEAPTKYDAIVKALYDRGHAMARNMDGYLAQLQDPVARMAHDFSPTSGAAAALRDGVHMFQLQRVLFGHRELPEHREKIGAAGVIDEYRYPPGAPQGFGPAAPPAPQGLPQRRLMRSMQVSDPAVLAVRQTQDRWYRWRARQDWNAVWGDNFRTWDRTWTGFRDEFDAILAPFFEHAREEPALFDIRARELYAKRVGVSYLLPPVDRGLLGFYAILLKRLMDDFGADLNDNAREGAILTQMIDRGAWAKAYRDGRDHPEATFAQIRQLVKEAVAERLRSADRSKPALIPSMVDLLACAAGKSDPEVRVSDDDLRQFEQKLAVLVPGQYAPEGAAPLDVLFIYPAQDGDDDIERYLRRHVPLPPDFVGNPQYRAVRADSMTVVLMRTNMGVTEVPEVRKVMKLWSDAQRAELPTDRLAWRRRLLSEPGYLLMTRRDRVNVLFRLLCAAWNGNLRVIGQPNSPESVEVRTGSRSDAAVMSLDLDPVGALSSWGGILQAYERFVLVDDSPVRRIISQSLMSEEPNGIWVGDIAAPREEFMAVVELGRSELLRIEDADGGDLTRRDSQLLVLREFWDVILGEALDRRIGSSVHTLRALANTFVSIPTDEEVEEAGGIDDVEEYPRE